MRDIVEKIREIEEEQKKRAAEDRLAKYNTGRKRHLKQIAFHKCKKRNRWVFGGNRSGKTECGAAECVYFARGIHPYRKNRKDTIGWVVSLSTQVQRDALAQQVADQQAKNQELSDAIQHKDDPETLERVAREKGYVKQNEVLFFDVAN